MLELHARNNRHMAQRVAALFEALRNAAAADDEIAELYATHKQQRLTGARYVAEAVVALGPLRDNMDLDTATDLIWTFNDPALWTTLVTDRGWPPELARPHHAGIPAAALTHHNPITSNPTCTSHPPTHNGRLQTQHPSSKPPAQDALSRHLPAPQQPVP